MSEGFRFRQFFVRHDRCAMKVGTDGVLLGAWARGGRHILDAGAGSGLVALMMSQRFPEAQVDGVEIDAAAAAQAAENVTASPFADKIRIYHTSLQLFAESDEREATYDALVCNPPFFIDSLTSPDKGRTVARHASALTPADLMQAASRLLDEEGELSVIIPADQVSRMEGEASIAGFRLARRTLLRTTPRKPLRRALLSFSRRPVIPAELSEQTLLTPDGRRGEWYEKLTADFYL
ncbi:MAG: tRNA1(Val) (adenine(37)-N6)-methyltransferase [Prevotella sp.]|jgi:tRNA1Val (adenine37-N6)-methyltransferase